MNAVLYALRFTLGVGLLLILGCGPASGTKSDEAAGVPSLELASSDDRNAAGLHAGHEEEEPAERSQVAARERGHEEEAHASGSREGGEGEAHEAAQSEGEPSDEGLVRLSPEQRKSAGIVSTPAGPGVIDAGVELLGEIRPNGDQVAHIFPRFAGLVLEVRKKTGDSVRAGDVLGLIENSDTLSTFPMKTMIDGVILEKEVTRGEAVERDKLCFVVANLGTVWLELSVYPRDLAEVRVGQEVVVASGEQAGGERAAISYLTPSIDSRTRTATARVVLDNALGQWRPGMFVTVRVVEEKAAEIAIPRSALQLVEGKSSVFVETDEGWMLRAVQPGREGKQMVEVLAGLAAGERVASTHAFLLKSELGKGEAGHDDD